MELIVLDEVCPVLRSQTILWKARR